MNEWRDVQLADLVRFRNGKSTKGLEPGAYPVYGSNGIIGTGAQHMYENAIILGRVGAYCGSVEYCPGKFWASDNTIVVEPLEQHLDTAFAAYMFRLANLNRYAGGSAQPLLTQTNLKGLSFSVPPVEAQRRIASILSAYDDLIEVNRRRIAVLEEMARGLFEACVTKLIGELPPASGGFGHATLPDGWHIADLGEIAEIIMGQSPPSEELNKDGDGFPFHQGVTDFGPLFPRRRIFCVPSNKKKIAATGDILFSVRAPVGRINLATEAIVLGRGVSSLRSAIGTQHYLAAHLRATFYEPDLIGNGAIYKAVGRKDIQRIPITLPPAEIRNELDAKIASIYDLLWTLEQSNSALAASRDLLLPRLISGQLSITEAERELEEAA